MRSRWGPVLAGAGLLLAVLLFRGIPYLTQQREVSSATPTPNAVGAVSPIMLKPRSQVCSTLVTFSPDSQVARVVAVGDAAKKGPALSVTASGPGYKASSPVPAGYPGTGPVEVRLKTPQKSLIGQFCVRNDGPAQAVL